MSYDNVAFELDLGDLDPELAGSIDNAKLKGLFVGLANTAWRLNHAATSVPPEPLATPNNISVILCLWEGSELRLIINSCIVRDDGMAIRSKQDVLKPSCIYENGRQYVQLLDEQNNVLMPDLGEYQKDIVAINLGLVAGALLADS